MPLKFGTSGVRGLVSDFTDKEVYLLVTAFLRYACPHSESTPVATGMDLRESSPNILKAAHRAIADYDCPIYSCGVLPTPALAYFAQIKKILSLIVTGSHIPADRNGIKFYLTTGETLKQDDENIFAIYQELRAANFSSDLFDAEGNFREGKQIPLQESSAQASCLYVQRYTDFFPKLSLDGMKVLVYQHSSVARDLLPKILNDLGASTILLGRSDTFIPVDTEAVESLDQFKLWIKEHGADALVSTDGDGDRPLFIDNQGYLVQGDKLGAICAHTLSIEAIALPISCNSGISTIHSFKEVVFTKIGSPYVVEALNILSDRYQTVAGFEANGGFILHSEIRGSTTLTPLPTRDSILPLLCILSAAKKSGAQVSDLLKTLPSRFTASALVRECSPEKSITIISNALNAPQRTLAPITGSKTTIASTNTLDGVRLTTEQAEVIHFRPSGNAPEFRCYTEAASQERADELAAAAYTVITDLIKN